MLERAVPYQPTWRLERSLQLTATTWFHDDRWGVQRQEELIEGYARWLADYGVLRSAEVWRGATTNEFLEEHIG